MDTKDTVRFDDDVGREQSDKALPPEDQIPEEDVTAVEPAGTVFISYRADPDQPIAIAVKRLLRAAIDPTPDVFVSGDGGLRPSSIGYKPQLQTAAQKAKAFVGIITPASKAREWIFFEAGTAWGCGQIYAPLLVEAKPEDLTSTIADYEATNASDKASVQRLVESIAQALGARVKPHFGTRYGAFERALEAMKSSETDNEVIDEDDPNRREFLRGLRMLVNGDRADAEKIFLDLESSMAEKDPLRSEIDVVRVVFAPDKTSTQSLIELERLSESTKQSGIWQYWMGFYEQIPAKAIRHLRSYLSGSDLRLKDFATTRLAELLLEVGQTNEAWDVVRTAISGESRQLRSNAAALFHKKWGAADPLLRLLLLAYGLASFPEAKSIDDIVNFAIDKGWPAVAIYYARLSEERKDGTSLSLGRAFHTFDFPSHAFLAYRRAANAGIDVAKANMAALLHTHAIAAAGLEVLDTHVGRFDASDPAFPFLVRSELESEVQKEKLTVSAIEDHGRCVAGLLASIAEAGFTERASLEPLKTMYVMGDQTLLCNNAGTSFRYQMTPSGASGTLRRLSPELPFWVMNEDAPAVKGVATLLGGTGNTKQIQTLLVQSSSGELRGFTYAFGDRDASPVPLVIQPAESSVSMDISTLSKSALPATLSEN